MVEKVKYLRVTMLDGSKYDVPAFLIAENRACYYTSREGALAYREEYDFAMKNDSELIDWATNNMNWEDVKRYAKQAGKSEVDYQEGWLNGEKEIVEY